MNQRKQRGLILALSIFLLLTIMGCGGTKSSNTSANSPANATSPASKESVGISDNTKPTTPASAVKVTLYFPTSDAEGLVPVERTLTTTPENAIAAIFKEFANPPAGLVAPLPKGTELLNSKIKEGTVTLNLSKNFKNNFEGGATGEQMVLYSIVNSLTSLPEIKSVEFLLEGQQTVAILGALDTSTPVKPNKSLNLK
jgi:germination protein M